MCNQLREERLSFCADSAMKHGTYPTKCCLKKGDTIVEKSKVQPAPKLPYEPDIPGKHVSIQQNSQAETNESDNESDNESNSEGLILGG